MRPPAAPAAANNDSSTAPAEKTKHNTEPWTPTALLHSDHIIHFQLMSNQGDKKVKYQSRGSRATASPLIPYQALRREYKIAI